jgi:hypothetical protein
MLPLLRYQFGAVDFIIQNNPGGKLKHFFIEWNLAPGWTIKRTEDWYLDKFSELKNETLDSIEAYESGLLKENIKDYEGKDEDGRKPHFIWGNVEPNAPIADIIEPDEMMQDALAQYDIPSTGVILQSDEITRALLVNNLTAHRYEKATCVECGTKWYKIKEIVLMCPWCGMDL